MVLLQLTSQGLWKPHCLRGQELYQPLRANLNLPNASLCILIGATEDINFTDTLETQGEDNVG